MDITHDNVCSSMLSCFYSHLLSTGRPISSFKESPTKSLLVWQNLYFFSKNMQMVIVLPLRFFYLRGSRGGQGT